MRRSEQLPRYDHHQSYDWNYVNAPEPVPVEVPEWPGTSGFCGLPVDSPLGIPAGPLLNGKWVLYYAHLGFDVLTYKTVRSMERACYPLPNLQPVHAKSLTGNEAILSASATMEGSWAVSFGMPSKAPSDWQRDVEWTRRTLPKAKLLSVSVVGSVQPEWTLDDLAEDYARCAKWALDSGADAVEANFSCPNVSTEDGQLYQQPESAALVAAKVRDTIGRAPFIVKIGHVNREEEAGRLLNALSPYVDALAMTNSVATRVQASDGSWLFDGQKRGICGRATREASTQQTRLFAGLIRQHGFPTRVIGVGGAGTANDVRDYLEAGAEAVHIATAAMVDPLVAVRIRAEVTKAR